MLDILDNDHIIFHKNENDEMKGGYSIEKLGEQDRTINDAGLARFKNLVVPLGLKVDNKDLSYLKGGSHNITKVVDKNLVPDELFNKLFDMVSVKKFNTNRQTKKNISKPETNKTRKQ